MIVSIIFKVTPYVFPDCLKEVLEALVAEHVWWISAIPSVLLILIVIAVSSVF